MISIILPAYNAAAFVSDAIDSVFAQSFEDWELILIDDGSTDDTAEKVRQFQDDRIRLIQQENCGVSAARNRGLDAATGKYVTFLDADDLLPPKSLEARVSYLESHPDVDILSGNVSIERGTSGDVLRVYKPRYALVELFARLVRLDESVFLGIVYMIRRESIGDHRLPMGISHAEDLIFFLTVAHDNGLVHAGVAEVVYRYRTHDASAMTNLDGLEAGYLSVLRHVAKLPKATREQQWYLRRKIASIMFKTWLRKGRPFRAIRAVGTCLTVR